MGRTWDNRTRDNLFKPEASPSSHFLFTAALLDQATVRPFRCSTSHQLTQGFTYLFLSEVHVWPLELHFQRSLCSRRPFKPPNRYMQLWWAMAE